MIRNIVIALLLVVVLPQFAVPTALAAGGAPSGSCAPGFTLVMAMDHNNHHHQHVGTNADLNGDGSICVKSVTSSGKIHVHIDNTVS